MFVENKRKLEWKVVIIGAGNIAAKFDTPNSEKIITHAHLFSIDTRFELLGFYDVDIKKAQEAAIVWGGKAFQDFSEAVKDAEIAICCVPDSFHAEYLKRLAMLDLRLIVIEKPICQSKEQLLEMKQIVNGESILVNYSRRFISDIQELKNHIKEYGSFIKGTGFYGKGLIHNGSHMIDLLRFLFGTVSIDHVLEYQIHDYLEKDLSVDAILKIQDGLFYLESIDSRMVTVFEIDLMFENARIKLLDGGTLIEIYKQNEQADGYKRYELSKRITIDYSKAMRGMGDNIWGYLNGDEKLKCDLKDAIEDIDICFGIRR